MAVCRPLWTICGEEKRGSDWILERKQLNKANNLDDVGRFMAFFAHIRIRFECVVRRYRSCSVGVL